MNITDFFKNEFSAFAMYNSYRMIASYVDGLKPSSRKVIHTMRNNTKRVKVAQLCSEVSSKTNYLHGEGNLAGVIVNLACSYPGSNNINVLDPDGSFGNRCIPEAAAPRYIHTKKSDDFDRIFKPEDYPLLTEQIFEGDKIEPLFFLPTLPLILVNGSEGVGSGWSQKILPRDPNRIKGLIKKYLEEEKLPNSIKPHFRGFTGKIEKDEGETSWKITGCFERINTTKIRITEIPITYTLDRYKKILTDLEDKKIITNFKDLSEPKSNKFEFLITCRRSFSAQDDEKLLQDLKLVSRVTENFTCVDEKNSVREFKSEVEIFEAFVDFRLNYYARRKQYLLDTINRNLTIASQKYKFIKMVVDDELKIMKRSKSQIENDLAENNFEQIDESYDYLLKMPVHSFTIDTMKELDKKCKDYRKEYKELDKKTPENLWEEDLV